MRGGRRSHRLQTVSWRKVSRVSSGIVANVNLHLHCSAVARITTFCCRASDIDTAAEQIRDVSAVRRRISLWARRSPTRIMPRQHLARAGLRIHLVERGATPTKSATYSPSIPSHGPHESGRQSWSSSRPRRAGHGPPPTRNAAMQFESARGHENLASRGAQEPQICTGRRLSCPQQPFQRRSISFPLVHSDRV